MQSETALTLLCGSAILIIVAMVILTASNLGLQGASVKDVTGNYLPVGFEEPIKRPEFVPVQVNQDNPLCYENAVADCMRINSGINFAKCMQQASYDCGRAPIIAYCILPSGFELKYRTKDDCLHSVLPECQVRCAPGLVSDCVAISKSMCLNIGLRNMPLRYPVMPLTTKKDFGLVHDDVQGY